MTKRLAITVRLRERILTAINNGALWGGERLPSSRELAAEFRADPRVVAAAYREIAMEGLVEIRPKSGVYVSSNATSKRGGPSLPINWVSNMFVDAVSRGVPLPELGPALLDFAEARRIRAAAVADTVDQAFGIGRELKRDYGIDATCHHLAEIQGSRLPPKFKAARVIFAANDCSADVRNVATTLGLPVVAISLRADLFDAEWGPVIEREVYVVVADPGFARKVRRVISRTGASARVRLMVVGRDDLASIPGGAPTYLTESARRAIGKTRLPGRVITPRRLFSDATVRAIVSFIVVHNSSAA